MARVLLADSWPLFNDAHQVIGCCSSAKGALTVVSRLEAATFAMGCSVELELASGGAGLDN